VVQFSCRFGEYLASPRRLAIDGYEGDLLLHNFWNNAISLWSSLDGSRKWPNA
jgi:hypothetical protein